jgi:hypothetical protein
MVFVKRRAIGVAAVVAISAWLVLGLVPSASAATVTGTSGLLTTSADDTNPAAGATITGYTGAGGPVSIPNTVVINAVTYTVTAIGAHAFDTKLVTSVVIPTTVTGIGDQAFASDDLSTVALPAGLTSLGDSAFANNSLTGITIPNGITEIPFNAFDGNNIASITFGNAVTTIDNNAFANNDNINDIVIPATVTSIGTTAFGQDPSLTHLGFRGPAPTTFTAAGVSGSLGPGTGLTVNYLWRFGPPTVPAGGFSSPTWQGYNIVPIVRVSFNMDGHGAAIADDEFQSGDNPTAPADPTAAGRTFLGWFTDGSLTTKFDFTATQTTDTVAFAGWSGLAETGVAISPVAIPLAVGVVVLGVLLLVIAWLRRRRAS